MTAQRLLVVDDETVLRDVLCKLLQKPTREVVGVDGYGSAMQAAGEAPFDAALVDKNLVGESGLELARALRRQHPSTEVILMSGYASLESAIEAVQLGCFEYVTKPIDDFAALDLKVQNAIDKSRLLRRQQELARELIQSELRFRTLFEATPDALLVCDARTGNILDANPAALKLYGHSAMQLQALRHADLVEGSDHRRRDGTTFAAEVTRSHLELNGKPVETLCVRDVSLRRAAEREQRELEARLRQVQKMDAIGRLASGVAHDFNNLLSVTSAHADFLADRVTSDPLALQDVEAIRGAARRGAALTRQLLLFGRVKPSTVSAVDVNELVAEVRNLLGRVLGAQVQLEALLEALPSQVMIDPDQLSQVLINLAINGRDAMPSGGVLEIRTSSLFAEDIVACHGCELPPGPYVRLSVRDHGSGMPREVLNRLFEPFFTTKEPGRGNGLGLATAFGIVGNAGGGLQVESEPGRGCTFSVVLPAVIEGVVESRPGLQSGPRRA